MMDDHFKQLEIKLGQLLNLLSGDLNAQNKKDVQNFIDVGEYGLALETIIDGIVVGSHQISPETRTMIDDTAAMMKLDIKAYEARLRANLKEKQES